MNDLSGLSWDATPPSNAPPKANKTSQFVPLRPAPPLLSRGPSPLSSGRSTPSTNANQAPRTAGQDSFASLLAPNASKKANGTSLQERQKQLLEEKARQASLNQKRHEEQFRTNDNAFWEGFGSGRSTPAQVPPAASQSTGQSSEDLDDILSAFKASAPVDASSHFPPPQHNDGISSDYSSRSHSMRSGYAASASRTSSTNPKEQSLLAQDDEDPFGLGQMTRPTPSFSNQQSPPIQMDDDEDVLGVLGKPVSQAPPRRQPELRLDNEEEEEYDEQEEALEDSMPRSGSPHDKAIAELVDMGFPVDKSRDALKYTSTGVNVQEAVSWLLNQAHEEARSKSKAKGPAIAAGPGAEKSRSRANGRQTENTSGNGEPAWMRQTSRTDRNTNSRSPVPGEKDVAQYASQLGNTLFKSANTLWKTGQKKAQKALAEFQQPDGEHGQPRWMRDGESVSAEKVQRGKGQDVTDEAAMLEPGRGPPPKRPENRRVPEPDVFLPQRQRHVPFDEMVRNGSSRPLSRPVEKISRLAVEEESAQAYISPARRKKPMPTPQPAAPPPAEPEPSFDIFSDVQAPPQQPIANLRSSSTPAISSSKSKPPTLAPRPKAAARATPAISPAALGTSTKQRLAGSAAFKRGDYSEATTLYSAALSPLPPQHPITIILRCNRALTHLKTGDAKGAIADADAALNLIGPSRGEDESIILSSDEPEKPMKEFYGKALMRKAEAFEHMEKWRDATIIWRQAVEAGVGGPLSIQGRNRCEKAAGIASSSSSSSVPTSRPAAAARPPVRKAVTTAISKPATRKPASALSDLGPAPSSDAVNRLRAANAAAEQASDEAFALNDVVTARISGWRDGKEENLRALLSSLENVLWEGANWTKVGLGDLVMPNRVKVIYMKAIARVHPDKIAQDATTEQKMVSASVFAALNEAWDKFKKDNGM